MGTGRSRHVLRANKLVDVVGKRIESCGVCALISICIFSLRDIYTELKRSLITKILFLNSPFSRLIVFSL